MEDTPYGATDPMRGMATAAAPGGTAEDTASIFTMHGDLDASVVPMVKERLLEHLEAHGPSIAVDLASVQFIDSTGLGLLVGMLQHARRLQGDVLLLNPNRQISRILQATGLEGLFVIRYR